MNKFDQCINVNERDLPWNDGVPSDTPIVFDMVNISVTNPTIQDFDRNVVYSIHSTISKKKI